MKIRWLRIVKSMPVHIFYWMLKENIMFMASWLVACYVLFHIMIVLTHIKLNIMCKDSTYPIKIIKVSPNQVPSDL